LELKFGNSHALIEMVHKIAKREGWLANALAEGVAKAAEIIGKDSSKYACHIGGLEPWGYDLRSLKQQR
jgi:aldehyde:ferredoxin oxidoreductase